MTREQANKKSANMLKNLTTEELLNQWETTSNMKMSVELATTRGWIMDELETRHPEKVNTYYDGFYEDEELRGIILN